MTIHGHPRCILRQAFRAALIAGLGCGLAQPAAAAGPEEVAPAVGRQVRSDSATIAKMIEQASEQSETFRNLVGIIHAGNGIVYVEDGQCGGSMRACLVTVTPAKPDYRILHVRVDVVKAGADLAGSIGHELYHATEVLGHPSVTNGTAMFYMFRSTGYSTSGRSFETSGAVKAGHAVRGEMRVASQKHGRLP